MNSGPPCKGSLSRPRNEVLEDMEDGLVPSSSNLNEVTKLGESLPVSGMLFVSGSLMGEKPAFVGERVTFSNETSDCRFVRGENVDLMGVRDDGESKVENLSCFGLVGLEEREIDLWLAVSAPSSESAKKWEWSSLSSVGDSERTPNEDIYYFKLQ